MEYAYMKDSYMKELETEVKEVNGNKVILEDTIFYPESGGQASDEGIIKRGNETFKMLEAKKEAGKIIHSLDKEGLKVGDKVFCILNWERRYKLMRSHTAEHIFSAIFENELGALVTGNKLTTEKMRTDFNVEKLEREQIKEFIEKANNIIKKNLPITTYSMTREEVEKKPEMVKLAMGLPPGIKILRILKIGNFNEQPDGGTHVKSTAEIGEIEFLDYETKGKNNKRVYVKLKP